MCGIVGIFRHNMTNNDVDLFERLLLADVFRGDHSTGVFRLMADKTNSEIFKDAMPSPFYLYSDGWTKLRGDTYPGAGKLQPLSPLYVGHNRYATMGAKTAENAHPFTVGKITLVHNGSLTKSRMSNDKDFEVDSHGICDLIDKKGLDEALKEMDGAFALVWWNSEEKTLNFFRNDKRPMSINKYEDGTYAWASEGMMLDWIFSRKGSSTTTVKTLERSFSLPVGMLFQLHYDGTTITELGFTKKTLPTFSYYNSWNSSSNNYGSGSSGRSYPTETEEQRFDKRFAEAGIDLSEVETPSNKLLVRLENMTFSKGTSVATFGTIEAELAGLDVALEMLDYNEEDGITYFMDGYVTDTADVCVRGYSIPVPEWDKVSASEEVFAEVYSVYSLGTEQAKDQRLCISVKNLKTELTDEEKARVLNPVTVPLAIEEWESKTVTGDEVNGMAERVSATLEDLLAEAQEEKDAGDVEVKNLSGTIRSVKQIEKVDFDCSFCTSPMSVEEFKNSKTWSDGTSFICEYCSTMA